MRFIDETDCKLSVSNGSVRDICPQHDVKQVTSHKALHHKKMHFIRRKT